MLLMHEDTALTALPFYELYCSCTVVQLLMSEDVQLDSLFISYALLILLVKFKTFNMTQHHKDNNLRRLLLLRTSTDIPSGLG